jgi:Uma2 family endonuclease
MSTVPRNRSLSSTDAPLVPGQRLTQPEFHRRYLLCPEDEKWELVGGIVYMTSPLRYPHGRHHAELCWVLTSYAHATPGTEAADNISVILGKQSEPQPDLTLRITQACGGQSRLNEAKYVEGAPELLAEVSHSSRRLDLTDKRRDYERAGVMEYLVLCVEEAEAFWFHFPSGEEIKPNRRGVSRSHVFPGLWVDMDAVLGLDADKVRAALERGLASNPHAAFVKRLQKERRRLEGH